MLKENQIVIYVADISFLDEEYFPNDVIEDNKKITNADVLYQRRAAYSLLQKIAKDYLGRKLTKEESKIGPNHQPLLDNYHISISHSDSLVMVSLGTIKHGIDIEVYDKKRKYKELINKIITSREKQKHMSAEQFLELWTKKEAIYKSEIITDPYIPSNIETSEYYTKTGAIDHKSKTYYFSICCDPDADITFNKIG